MADQETLVNLTIDGKPVSVPPGSVIWAAAQKLGIEVPIYCYHPKMEPLGACRMCFVQVEKMPKLTTACTTVVQEGMAVHTNTPEVIKARQGTLEFLLINHPLDCPICDKGGECDLQDFTLRHGPGASRFDLNKRHFIKPIPVSENILLDRERCIACQRCVRFTQNVAMEDGLIMEQRGFRTQVGVDPNAPFDSIFSGNVVEMCPVGALTAKSYRFVSRPWELKKTASVCANCSVGCNVRVDVRVNRVLRQYSRTNDDIDDGWLCDRGRWDHDAINSPERLRTPLVRRDGKLAPATWEEAISAVASRLSDIASHAGGGAIGGIGSRHTTNEEAYLFQKLMRAGFQSNNVDHFHGNFPRTGKNELPWAFTSSIAEIDHARHILILSGDPYHRQPIIDLRIRKAIRAGAQVFVITPEPNKLDRLATKAVRYTPGTTPRIARALLQVVLSEGLTRGEFATARAESLKSRLAGLEQDTPESVTAAAGVDADVLRDIARELAASPAAILLYDEASTREQGGERLAGDMLDLALLTNNYGHAGAGVGPLFEANNSLGARDMGVLPDMLPGYRPVADASARAGLRGVWGSSLPDTPGMSYEQMLSGGVKALYVMGADPARHISAGQLDRLEFLVVQDLFLTETAKHAHVVLPAVAYTEKNGTFTNTERAVQVVRQAMTPLPGARPDWEILTSVARALGLDWAYDSAAHVLREIAHAIPLYAGVSRTALGTKGARWPFVQTGTAADGRLSVTGSPHLTWKMLEEGVAPASAANEQLATMHRRGE